MSKQLHDTPTEQDLQSELETKYATVQRDPEATIFCPWCGKGNKIGLGACCGSFADGIRKIGERQLASVERQLKEVRLGRRRTIMCPYCLRSTKRLPYMPPPSIWPRPNVSPFCCDTMQLAAGAIADRQRLKDLQEQKAKIEDGAFGGSPN